MRIFVKVKARAKQKSLDKIDDTHYRVSVKEPPVDGKANLAVIRTLAEYLKVPRSRITIVSGHTSKQKVIEIM